MSKVKEKQEADDVRDEPVYWFVTLEKARERNDFAAAAEAQAELRRLGVQVRYPRREVSR